MQKLTYAERSDLIVLAWLWCQRGKPATEANVATGIKSIAPDGSAKALAATTLERLAGAGQIEKIAPAAKRGKASFKITEAGAAKVSEWLGRKELPAGRSPFGSISGYELPAIASGLPIPVDAKSQKALVKLLTAEICSRGFELPIPLDRGPEAAKLELVKVALSRTSHVPTDRIYLKKLPGGELPALVVGPLLKEPGTAIANLDKLLAAAACKVLGDCKPAQIKAAVVRRWFGADAPAAEVSHGAVGSDPALSSNAEAEVARGPATAPAMTEPSSPVAPVSPLIDGAAFARDVLAAAKAVAQAGGPGVSILGDKVLVHYVWRKYEQAHGPMPLDVFKQRLSDAPVDQLVLVREDLIPSERAQEFKDSEVTTGISAYHYVRVGNLGEHHA